MPLIALLDGNRVEAPALVADADWQLVSGVGDRLTCPGCGQRMISRRGAVRIAHFAHYRNSSSCAWGAGETADHLRLKWLVCQIVRATPGWTADIEVCDVSASWRADVLASRDGRRIAFEIQLASQTVEETSSRSDRYTADSVEVVWLADREVAWLDTSPSLAVDLVSNEVIAGMWRFVEHWEAVDPQPLDKIVNSILAGSLTWQQLPDRRVFGSHARHHVGGGWTTSAHLDKWREWQERDRQAKADRLQRVTEPRARVDPVRSETLSTRVVSVAERVCAKLKAAGVTPTPRAPAIETAQAHAFEVDDKLVICDPPLKHLWRLNSPTRPTIVVFPTEEAAAAATQVRREHVTVCTISTFENHSSIADLLASAPPPLRAQSRSKIRWGADLGDLASLGPSAWSLYDALVRRGIRRSWWATAAEIFAGGDLAGDQPPEDVRAKLVDHYRGRCPDVDEVGRGIMAAVTEARLASPP